MYTEIVKIIEGGLKKDVKKVASYAKVLSENLAKEGNVNLSEKILNLLKEIKSQPVYMDQLISSPVDQETRLELLDLYMPNQEKQDIVLSKTMEHSISQFRNLVYHKNSLREAGLVVNSSLLLYGPPGYGKTTIAKHLSSILGLPLAVARLDSLVSSLLGNTSKNIRKIFEFASQRSCILFLDEFDAIAKARDDKHELGELKRVINSLLQNIDEFTENNILIAATNHPELLDKAIWRRFNQVIEINKLEREDLIQLISVNLKNFNTDFLNENKKTERLLNLLDKLSPSNIKSIIQNAAAKSIIEKKEKITHEDILFEIFLFKHNGTYNQEHLINFLKDQGISQSLITEICKVSIRQVRNSLKL